METAALTVKEDGPRAVLTATLPDQGRGLYKAWVVGPEGRCLLGTMAPEGRALAIRRTLSLSELRRCGAWPAQKAEAELTFAFPGEDLPPGWTGLHHVHSLPLPTELTAAIRGISGALVYTDRGGFFLALPWSSHQPVGLCALFCFAYLEQLGASPYLIFCFDRNGQPCFLHKTDINRSH